MEKNKNLIWIFGGLFFLVGGIIFFTVHHDPFIYTFTSVNNEPSPPFPDFELTLPQQMVLAGLGSSLLTGVAAMFTFLYRRFKR